MFRTAAVLIFAFGAIWIWRFGFTDYHPEQRPFGLAGGLAALIVGVFLFRLRRFAIGASAAASAVVGISAAVFAPEARGPAILVIAGLSVACVLYTVLAVRELAPRDGSKST